MDLGPSLPEVLDCVLTLLIRAGNESIDLQVCNHFLLLAVVTEDTEATVIPFPSPTAS